MELQMMDLRAEATAEAQRLIRARAYTAAADEHMRARSDRSGPLVSRARTPTMRQQLAGRVLVVVEIRVEDERGRTIATDVVGVLCDHRPAPHQGRGRDRARAALDAVDAVARAHLARTCAATADAAVEAARAFTQARVARDAAIAERFAATAPHLFQAGLFDRRAERASLSGAPGHRGPDGHGLARLQIIDFEKGAQPAVELLLALLP